jgi:hypothetical protein
MPGDPYDALEETSGAFTARWKESPSVGGEYTVLRGYADPGLYGTEVSFQDELAQSRMTVGAGRFCREVIGFMTCSNCGSV